MTASSEITRPLRLQLSPHPGTGLLDGCWWPYSHDLEVELADLVDHFPPETGRVSRVLFSRPDWGTHPRTVAVARGVIKTGSFPADDTHVVILKLGRDQQLKVLVVPPGTAPEQAERTMSEALSATNRRTAAELVAGMPGPGTSVG